jgi:ElaA protein
MLWKLKKFNELEVDELYAILQLRSDVFIVEQNCIYQDVDGKDQAAWHLMGTDGPELTAYSRILPPGISYSDPSIGRVVTLSSKRRSGLGRELMNVSIAECENLFGKTPITLGAQSYLIHFYESLGFLTVGDQYLEDGIPHIRMTRKASS